MSPTSSARQPGAGAGMARHAAFKVHRDSQSIHKAATSPLSSSSTNSSVSSSSNAVITSGGGHHRPSPALQPPPPRQRQQQQPVIIYTHSPKVIQTTPRDFMSIVQKLTGLDGPAHHGRGAGAPPAGTGRINSGSPVVTATPHDESSSSSSESCAHTHATGPPHPNVDSQLMPPPPPPAPSLVDAHFMAPDMPLLFAPDAAAASDLQQLCAPRGLYGQFPPVDASAAIGPVMPTNMNSATSNGGGVFSPSMVETVRTFPGYN